SHEWIKNEEEGIVSIGITEHAQSELGDIVYIELPKMGAAVKCEHVMAVLESTKAAVDIYAPITGEIVEVNELLKEAPDLINMAAESTGW
ncbi:glycine cleavage system protein GcvH, partial [Acinetobacter baumannii]